MVCTFLQKQQNQGAFGLGTWNKLGSSIPIGYNTFTPSIPMACLAVIIPSSHPQPGTGATRPARRHSVASTDGLSVLWASWEFGISDSLSLRQFFSIYIQYIHIYRVQRYIYHFVIHSYTFVYAMSPTLDFFGLPDLLPLNTSYVISSSLSLA